jgi:glycosyltransferase involved in cell wall biosynthesis
MKVQACSVLLPLYNGSKFIDQSLNTILASMREVDELVVVNDGSEDISVDDLKKLETRDSRIKIISKKHSGLVETLNYGIQHCENELIARADIDDIYSSKRISRQVLFMGENPNCAAVFSDYQIQDVSGRVLGIIPTAISPLLTHFSLINPQRTPHPSVMFRKSAVLEVNGYKSEYFPAEDLSLWIDLSKSFEIATIPETLLYYTLHGGNITSKNQSLMIAKTESLTTSFGRKVSIEAILHEAETTFNIYDLTTQAMARKVLFFRDLSKYLRHNPEYRFTNLPKQISLFAQTCRPNLIPVVLDLKKMQKRRKNL